MATGSLTYIFVHPVHTTCLPQVGNGALTLAEQRSHFALWCVTKSPLILGANISALTADSLAILKNKALIAINQDSLGIQGTLRATSDVERRYVSSVSSMAVVGQSSKSADVTQAPPSPPSPPVPTSPWMTHCKFGAAPETQQWAIDTDGKRLVQPSAQKCLSRSAHESAVTVVACDKQNESQEWDFGRVNNTVWQVRDPMNSSSCLTFNSSSLHMELCGVETGDHTTPQNCTAGDCRFSGIIYQLWYVLYERFLLLLYAAPITISFEHYHHVLFSRQARTHD